MSQSPETEIPEQTSSGATQQSAPPTPASADKSEEEKVQEEIRAQPDTLVTSSSTSNTTTILPSASNSPHTVPPPGDTQVSDTKEGNDTHEKVSTDMQDQELKAASDSSSSAPSSEPETIPVRVKKYTWSPPADADRVPYRPHQGEGSQYLRDFILGVNDGLVSTFLVVVGVVGGGSSTLQGLLAGISATIAGALSMAIGEYIATKSQLQVSAGEYRLENEHFKYHRDVELEQLRSFLTNVNLSGNLLEAVVSEVGRSDEGLMKMMQAFEFGGEEELERSPLKAMWMSGRLFFIGSIPTLIPFFTPIAPLTAMWIAAGLVAACLFVVGAYKTKTTRGNPLYDGGENLILGAIGAAIAYAVGVAFQHASNT